MRKKTKIPRSVHRAVGIAALLYIAGSGDPYAQSTVSSGPQTPWAPSTQAVERQSSLPAPTENLHAFPTELFADSEHLSMATIVSIALLNSKQTRAAWAQARTLAAAYGSKKGAYLPQVSATGSGLRVKNPTLGAQASSGAWEFSPSASMSWLLLDFGGRKAAVEETREALFAADWMHNSTIQNVILQVEQAFYNYFAVKAFLSAQQAAMDETKKSLDATSDRHSAGVATIADVLQARTALSQSKLTLETLQGQLMTTRGVLATAMGFTASTAFDVELPVGEPPLNEAKKTVQEWLDLAIKNRPDLAAARAQELASIAHIRNVRSQAFPFATASAAVGELYFNNLSKGIGTYEAGITVTVPIFSGFSHYFDILGAKAQADAAHAATGAVQDLVTLQIWTSYYNLETAGQRVLTSGDLFESASQNYTVSLERYKSGVGSIIDLLTAQAALQNARAQQVQARVDWWLGASQLAHDAGLLETAALPKKDFEPPAGR